MPCVRYKSSFIGTNREFSKGWVEVMYIGTIEEKDEGESIVRDDRRRRLVREVCDWMEAGASRNPGGRDSEYGHISMSWVQIWDPLVVKQWCWRLGCPCWEWERAEERGGGLHNWLNLWDTADWVSVRWFNYCERGVVLYLYLIT